MGKIYEYPMEQPLPTKSLGQVMLEKIRKHGDSDFLIDGNNGERLTFRELLEKSVKLAKFLQMFGIRIGDRISIATENRLDWTIPLYATLYLGAVLAPHNPAYTEWEFRNALSISKPRIIFVSRRTEKIFVKLLPSLSWPVELIELDDVPLTPNIRTLTDILNNRRNVDISSYQATDIGDNSKHVAVILSSSGTTGPPKGVALSDRGLLVFIINGCDEQFFGIRRDDKAIVIVPFFHGYAFGLLLLCAITGCQGVVMPTFEPGMFLRLIQQYKITYLPLVPSLVTFLAKYPHLERNDLRSVRLILCGAAPLAKEIVLEVKTRFGLKDIRNGYGMTELSILVSVTEYEADDINAMRITRGFLSKVVDPETRETLDVGQIGELCFKSPQVMLGYWDNPETTNRVIDEDGWLYTGDAGYYDEEGRLHIVDRLKELIKYKSYQVSPSEIETVLLMHPAVQEAAVAGKPDERSGELPTALVVKKTGATATVQDIMGFVKEKLSPQKWLHGGLVFVDTIPKTSVGKLLRREVREIISKL